MVKLLGYLPLTLSRILLGKAGLLATISQQVVMVRFPCIMSLIFLLTYDTIQNPQEITSVLRKASIRRSAYGDPGLLPVDLINNYNRLVLFHTGYTNQ